MKSDKKVANEVIPLKRIEGPDNIVAKEPSAKDILDSLKLDDVAEIELLRGKTRKFSVLAYLVCVTLKFAGDYKLYFFLHELSENGLATDADKRAYEALNVAGRLSRNQYAEMVQRARMLQVTRQFREVDDLDVLFRPTSSAEDAINHHASLEKHLEECMFDGLIKKLSSCKCEEHAKKTPFIIIDKKSYIDKFGGITVGVHKEVLEEVLGDEQVSQNNERYLDKRLEELLRGMSAEGLCVLPPSGRLQQQIYFKEFSLKLYILRFPNLTKELEFYDK